MLKFCLWVFVGAIFLCGFVSGCSDDDDAGADSGQTAEEDDDNDDSGPDDDPGSGPGQADDDDDDDDDDTSPPDPVWSDLTPQGLPVGSILGMATQMYDGPDENPERSFEIEKLSEAGLLRLRASIDWPDVEPQQDQFTFDYSDPFVQLIVDSGLVFDGRLCYGVSWAAPDDNDSAIEPEDFGDYAYHVAEHYCGLVDSYEIWNEENLWVFWDPKPDPARYGEILKAAYQGVHEACPEAKVVWGGLSPFQIATMLQGPYQFMEDVFAEHPDIGDFFDVLAIHPYTFLQVPSPEWVFMLGDFEFFPSMPGQIRLAKERLSRIGAAGKPIWLTEWGWPSLLIGDQAQADYFVRGALLSMAEGVQALHWYTFYDREPGGSSIPTEDYFGLFTWPGAQEGPQAKPVYAAAATLSELLGSTRFAGDLSARLGLPEGVFGLAFLDESTEEIVFAAWDSRRKGGHSLTLPLPPGTTHYEVIDQYGQTVSEGENSGSISVELSRQVVYVRMN